MNHQLDAWRGRGAGAANTKTPRERLKSPADCGERGHLARSRLHPADDIRPLARSAILSGPGFSVSSPTITIPQQTLNTKGVPSSSPRLARRRSAYLGLVFIPQPQRGCAHPDGESMKIICSYLLSDFEHQRCSILQPRVGVTQEHLPWVTRSLSLNPGVASILEVKL